jgi:hypothetical protein
MWNDLDKYLENKLLNCQLSFARLEVNVFDQQAQQMRISLEDSRHYLKVDSVYEKKHWVNVSGMKVEFLRPISAIRWFFGVLTLFH